MLESNRYTFLLFLVSLNILLAIIVESFLRVKQEKRSVSEMGTVMSLADGTIYPVQGFVTVKMSDEQVGPKAFY